jgi:hypothetical protein
VDIVKHFDLCLVWNFKYDADFVDLLVNACRSLDISLLQITPDNYEAMIQDIMAERIGFQVFFDRASDTDVRFLPLVNWVHERGIACINPWDLAHRSCDKAAMHHAFINAGIYAPYSIILPSYREQPIIPPVDLSPLGDSFVIKPSRGGGGEGVITDATQFSQVLTARKEHPSNAYLLQEVIDPAKLGARPAWFRVIYCAGEVYPNWWDTQSHVYSPVTKEEESLYGLSALRDIALTISRICKLQLFSTEIAYNTENHFVVIDNVNDQIDLRLQSQAIDGVPDAIVHDIARRLADLVASQCAHAEHHGVAS